MGHVGEENGFCPVGLSGFLQSIRQLLFAYLFFDQDLPVLLINNMLSSHKINSTETQQQDNSDQQGRDHKVTERAGGGLQHICRYGDQQVPGASAHRHVYQIVAFAHPGKYQGAGRGGGHIFSKPVIRFPAVQVRMFQAVQVIVCDHHGVVIVGLQQDIAFFINDRGIPLFCVHVQGQKVFQLIKGRCHENAPYLRSIPNTLL